MVMAGMMVGIAHTRDTMREIEEVRLRAVVLVARQIVKNSSDVVAFSVAERMVMELVVNPQNDEQVFAAQEAAKRIAEEESEKIKKQVGCNKFEKIMS